MRLVALKQSSPASGREQTAAAATAVECAVDCHAQFPGDPFRFQEVRDPNNLVLVIGVTIRLNRRKTWFANPHA